jgi:hypothetical protein
MTTAWDALEGVDFVPRVDVQPSAPSAAFDALTVLLATGRDVKAMPEVRAVRDERGTMLGAHLCAPDQERVVLFGAAGSGPVEGAVAYSVATGRARHHLFDLVPHATYSVAVRGDRDLRVVLTPSATGLTADATGALVFDVSGEAVTPVPAVP